jgi:hypothetical protein
LVPSAVQQKEQSLYETKYRHCWQQENLLGGPDRVAKPDISVCGEQRYCERHDNHADDPNPRPEV